MNKKQAVIFLFILTAIISSLYAEKPRDLLPLKPGYQYVYRIGIPAGKKKKLRYTHVLMEVGSTNSKTDESGDLNIYDFIGLDRNKFSSVFYTTMLYHKKIKWLVDHSSSSDYTIICYGQIPSGAIVLAAKQSDPTNKTDVLSVPKPVLPAQIETGKSISVKWTDTDGTAWTGTLETAGSKTLKMYGKEKEAIEIILTGKSGDQEIREIRYYFPEIGLARQEFYVNGKLTETMELLGELVEFRKK